MSWKSEKIAIGVLDRHHQTSLPLFQFQEVLEENAFCKLFWSWEVLRNPLAHSQSVK